MRLLHNVTPVPNATQAAQHESCAECCQGQNEGIVRSQYGTKSNSIRDKHNKLQWENE